MARGSNVRGFVTGRNVPAVHTGDGPPPRRTHPGRAPGLYAIFGPAQHVDTRRPRTMPSSLRSPSATRTQAHETQQPELEARSSTGRPDDQNGDNGRSESRRRTRQRSHEADAPASLGAQSRLRRHSCHRLTPTRNPPVEKRQHGNLFRPGPATLAGRVPSESPRGELPDGRSARPAVAPRLHRDPDRPAVTTARHRAVAERRRRRRGPTPVQRRTADYERRPRRRESPGARRRSLDPDRSGRLPGS